MAVGGLRLPPVAEGGAGKLGAWDAAGIAPRDGMGSGLPMSVVDGEADDVSRVPGSGGGIRGEVPNSSKGDFPLGEEDGGGGTAKPLEGAVAGVAGTVGMAGGGRATALPVSGGDAIVGGMTSTGGTGGKVAGGDWRPAPGDGVQDPVVDGGVGVVLGPSGGGVGIWPGCVLTVPNMAFGMELAVDSPLPGPVMAPEDGE